MPQPSGNCAVTQRTRPPPNRLPHKDRSSGSWGRNTGYGCCPARRPAAQWHSPQPPASAPGWTHRRPPSAGTAPPAGRTRKRDDRTRCPQRASPAAAWHIPMPARGGPPKTAGKTDCCRKFPFPSQWGSKTTGSHRCSATAVQTKRTGPSTSGRPHWHLPYFAVVPWVNLVSFSAPAQSGRDLPPPAPAERLR